MKNIFDLKKMQKKGEAGHKVISVAVGVLLLGIFAPIALLNVFNTTAYGTATPAWVPLAIGALAVVAFIYALLPSGK